MDYNAFFADVEIWIGQANQAAVRLGMESPEFWQWVAESSGTLCKKYQEHRLAIKQMIMMIEWLEEVWEGRRNANAGS
ncbi:hypothetical protein ABDI30_12020 [Paenibacillus cisolokensis]|uniref:hypothetical protein n=1 Tax=Paenibacillus cisolokensis TaxID=1658519 RepID=UPI003D2655A1